MPAGGAVVKSRLPFLHSAGLAMALAGVQYRLRAPAIISTASPQCTGTADAPSSVNFTVAGEIEPYTSSDNCRPGNYPGSVRRRMAREAAARSSKGPAS